MGLFRGKTSEDSFGPLLTEIRKEHVIRHRPDHTQIRNAPRGLSMNYFLATYPPDSHP
jgi:hypothetical protein